MMDELPSMTFEELLPDVTDLGIDFPEVAPVWQWIFPAPPAPLLLTALGDLFVTIDGTVHFLDTMRGKLTYAAASRQEFKTAVDDPERMWEWFHPDLVLEFRTHAAPLKRGEVFSPVIPPALGGTLEPANFWPTPWTAHLHTMGQIHEQIRHFPPGTRIDRFIVG